jgi:hypothetical protein
MPLLRLTIDDSRRSNQSGPLQNTELKLPRNGVQTYIVVATENLFPPNQQYLTHLRDGARQHGVPEGFQALLAALYASKTYERRRGAGVSRLELFSWPRQRSQLRPFGSRPCNRHRLVPARGISAVQGLLDQAAAGCRVDNSPRPSRQPVGHRRLHVPDQARRRDSDGRCRRALPPNGCGGGRPRSFNQHVFERHA